MTTNLFDQEKLSLISRCFNMDYDGKTCIGFTAIVPLRDPLLPESDPGLDESLWVFYTFTKLSDEIFTTARLSLDGTEVPIGILQGRSGEYTAERFVLAQCSKDGMDYVDWGTIEKFM